MMPGRKQSHQDEESGQESKLVSNSQLIKSKYSGNEKIIKVTNFSFLENTTIANPYILQGGKLCENPRKI